MSKARTMYCTPDGYPDISFGMLLNFLKDHQICYKPSKFTGTIQGFVSLPSKEDLPSLVIPINHTTLVITYLDMAKGILDTYPQTLVLVLSKGEDIPDWIPEYKDRVVIIEKRENFSHFLLLFQEYLFGIMVWSNALNHISPSDSALQEIIDVSEAFFKGFMAINDGGYNVIACSKNTIINDRAIEELVTNGYHSKEMIVYITSQDENDISSKKVESPFRDQSICYPIVIQNVVFGHVLLVCNGKITEGIRELFLLLLKKVHSVYNATWEYKLYSAFPQGAFFVKMLKGDSLEPEYTKMQIELTRIPEMPQLRLFLIQFEDSGLIEKERALSIIESVEAMNGGDSYCFMFEGAFVALFFAKEDDKLFSNKSIVHEFKDTILSRFQVVIGVSQIFERVTEIRLAYRQARMTLSYKEAIDIERIDPGNTQPLNIYPFETAFIYCLLNRDEFDDDLLEFSSSHTLLEKILAEDKINGTNDTYLLWVYLCFNYNAHAVATHLYMHRNTVNYHIRKLEKRFDIDFANPTIRDRLLGDYKVLFATATQQNNREIIELFSRSSMETKH